MSIIKYDKNYIFIHIPKNAGTSIENIIGGSSHNTILDISKKVDINKYFKWCVCREPFSRLISSYCYSRYKGFVSKYIAFDEYAKFACNEIIKYNGAYTESELVKYSDKFIKKHKSRIFHSLPQYFFITINNELCIDFICKMENIDYDILKINNIVGTLQLNKDNVTPPCIEKTLYDEKIQYDEELKDLIIEAYNIDFRFFEKGTNNESNC